MLIITPFVLAALITVTVITTMLTVMFVIIEKKRAADERTNVIYPRHDAGIVGVMCSVLMTVIMIVMAFGRADACYVMMVIAVISWPLIIAYFSYKIQYDDEGFVYRNFFGKKYKCSYSEVKGIRTGKYYQNRGKSSVIEYKVFFKNTSMELNYVGDERVFLDKLMREYENITVQKLPISSSFGRKYDPMNGNMQHPWAFVIGFCICAVVCLSFATAIIIEEFTFPWEIENVKADFYFRYYEENDGILLSDDFEDKLKIENYNRYNDKFSSLYQFCDGKTYELTVDRELNYVIIVGMIGEDGEVYISPEETIGHWDASQVLGVVMAVLLLCGAFYFIMGIFVRRNPERYSKRVFKLYKLKNE